MTNQTKRCFEPLDELRYGLIDEAKIAPDGQTAVYTLTRHNLDDETTATIHMAMCDPQCITENELYCVQWNMGGMSYIGDKGYFTVP